MLTTINMADCGINNRNMDYMNLVQSFLTNRKNANSIITLINNLEEDSDNLNQCIAALQDLFDQILKRGDLIIDANLKLSNPNEYAVEEKYITWLTGVYEKFFCDLLVILGKNVGDVQVQAVGTIFQLIISEARSSNGKFPIEKFEKFISYILHNEDDKLCDNIVVYLSYRDILFYCWKALKDIILKETSFDDQFVFNVLDLLEKIKPPKDIDSLPLLCYDDADNFKQYNEDILFKSMQKSWMKLTNCTLNVVNHRKLLIVLVEGYLSLLPKPTLLTDFLVGSLSLGGATSLLALQGMSTLVTKHNLECPDIFGKLYNMFQVDIFYTRYKARLFYLADIFLQSTYVPEQLVAAFAKRISRLSLFAQASDLVLIMQFVGNIMIRHPALSVMIHSTSNEFVDADPFNMNESDPMKSRACESSLWELAMMKNHVQPKVAAAAKFMDSNLPAVEWDIRNELDTTYSTMFAKELNSRGEQALNHIRPSTGIKQLTDDRLYKMWSLT